MSAITWMTITAAFLTSVTPSNPHVTSQADLDYIGRWMKVNFDVLSNLHVRYGCIARITLTNTGQNRINPGSWVVYLTSMAAIAGNVQPVGKVKRKPKVLKTEVKQETKIEKSQLIIKRVKASLYSLTPVETIFSGLDPGQNVSVVVSGRGTNTARSNSMPNWYVSAPGFEPRVFTSTVGEELAFVGRFLKEESWKQGKKDRFSPWTPEDRFFRAFDVDDDRLSSRYGVIPKPKSVNLDVNDLLDLGKGSWIIRVLEEDKDLLPAAKFLADRCSSFTLSEDRDPGTSRVIQFVLEASRYRSTDLDLIKESYELSINKEALAITVKATHERGAFYAVQTLLSLMGDDWKVPVGSVHDIPRFSYRGLHLDVARNFKTVDDVLLILDVLALYKMNKLHLHLADDEGWRLQVPDLPELTELGSQRCHDLSETICLLPFLGSGPYATTSGSGYYTSEDYKIILRRAKERHIEIVPEIDLPGHARAAIKSMMLRYKTFERKGERKEATKYLLTEIGDRSVFDSVQGYNDSVVNPCLNSTYKFIEKVLQTLQYLHSSISPLKKFHFGGDEVPRNSWSASKACKAVLGRHPTRDPTKKLQHYFAERLGRIVKNLEGAVSLAAWEDGLSDKMEALDISKVSPGRDAFVYPWKNLWEAKAAGKAYMLANAGYKVVMSQATHLYMDHPQEPDPEERGLYWATRFTDLKKIFLFTPLRLYSLIDTSRFGEPVSYIQACGKNSEFCPALKKKKNIVGMEAHLWAELVRTRGQMSSQLFPRLLAVAERAWHEADWETEIESTKSDRSKEAKIADWMHFASIVGRKELLRLDRLGVEYHIPPPGAHFKTGVLRTHSELPDLRVEVSLDDGCTWDDAVKYHIDRRDIKILLRTRSADGRRWSRVVALNESGNALECRKISSSVIFQHVCVFVIFVLVIVFYIRPRALVKGAVKSFYCGCLLLANRLRACRLKKIADSKRLSMKNGSRKHSNE